MSEGDSGKDKATGGGSDSAPGDRDRVDSYLVDMTDENMLNRLLAPKVRGEVFEEEKHVKPQHRGELEPVAYLNSNAVSRFVPIAYFYKEMVPLECKKDTANVHYNRSAGAHLGNWKSTGKKLALKDENGEVVGYRNGLIYIPMKDKSPNHKKWTYNMRDISMPGTHLSVCELQRGPKTKGKANAQACSSSVIPATDVVEVAEAAEKAQDTGPLEGEEKEKLHVAPFASEDHRDGIAEDSVSTIASVDELIQAGEAQLS